MQLSGNKDGQTDNESVKTTRPGRLSMAGFQVTTHGRFSGDHRGNITAGEFSNALIEERVRRDIAAETMSIRELIVAIT